ncbi:hypothetical protein [Alkalibacillus haloalkaliphilus]|uniref:Uncharacterized protein n=1 Tax=Alkalibacillus haloalkaliphilus TaxID=94136 RepID=A0A511W583_9BACI|nr:hypothetical protein [Alkalibacillus haloalkaliphilus]GEN44522.1 hypothetical protein AHA02nite_02980 [Alkalibacillus haloalkaliphilus]
MKVTDSLIINKTEKYKKFYENYSISPNHININGKDFYITFFQTKLIKRANGSAVVSTKSSLSSEEVNSAYEKLVYLLNFITSALEGEFKLGSNMQGFKATQDFVEKVLSNVNLTESNKKLFEQCSQALKQVQQCQSDHDRVMYSYRDYLDDKSETGQKFYESDIDYVLEVMADLDYIQYYQVKASLDAAKLLKQAKKVKKQQPEIKKYMDRDVAFYIRLIVRGEVEAKRNLKELKRVDHMESLTEEEHKRLFKESAINNQKKYFPKLKKDLRNIELKN